MGFQPRQSGRPGGVLRGDDRVMVYGVRASMESVCSRTVQSSKICQCILSEGTGDTGGLPMVGE